MGRGSKKSWKIIIYSDFKTDLSIFETIMEPFIDGITIDQKSGNNGCQLTGFCSKEPDEVEFTSRLLIGTFSKDVSLPKYEIKVIDEVDWEAEYIARTPPIKAGKFFIYPDHFHGNFPVGSLPLAINAGLAFGTGEHQTTKGCLLALVKIVGSGLRIKTAIDVGCGSAILAIALSKLIPDASILACDNDLAAIMTAKDNVKKNECQTAVKVIQSDFYDASEIIPFTPFDLIISNILAGPLIGIARETAKQLDPGGRLVLSGIIKKQTTKVINEYSKVGLTVLDHLNFKEWVTLVFKFK